MQKLIEKLQYVADGLVKQGFGKDGESVFTIAQVIEELKQQSCKANVSGSLELLQQLLNRTHAAIGSQIINGGINRETLFELEALNRVMQMISVSSANDR